METMGILSTVGYSFLCSCVEKLRREAQSRVIAYNHEYVLTDALLHIHEYDVLASDNMHS